MRDNSPPPDLRPKFDAFDANLVCNLASERRRKLLTSWLSAFPENLRIDCRSIGQAAARAAEEAGVFREPTTLEKAFWTFHTIHPEVYRQLVRAARKWKGTRTRRVSFKEFLAYTGLKMNNNHHAYYARLLRNESESRVVFSLGVCRSEAEPFLGWDVVALAPGASRKRRMTRRKNRPVQKYVRIDGPLD